MTKVNAKILALKYKLVKALQKSIEKDKESIKNGAEVTFKDYCKIKVVECTRTSYTKEDQAKLDEYAKKMHIAKQVTHFKRIDIDEVSQEVDDKVQDIFNTLEDSNDKVISKVAKVASKVKGTI